MPDIKDIRCTKCKKLLAEGEMSDGKFTIKCKCGTMNTIEARPAAVDKPYIHNQPYQNRMALATK